MVLKAPADNLTIKVNINEINGSVLLVEAGEQKHIVRVARVTPLQPISETHVLVNTNVSGTVLLNLYRPFR